MRILVVSDLVRPNGAGVMALLGAQLLADAGHEIGIVAGAMDASLLRDLQARYPSAASFTHDERALDGSVTLSDHVAFLRAFRRWFDRQLRTIDPEVLYVHNCGRVFTQLDLADLSQQVRVVHTMHDEWFFTDAHYTFAPRAGAATVRTFEPGRAEHILEHRFDHVFDVPGRVGDFTAVAPSSWLAQRARQVFPTVDIRHLPNAVDTEMFDLQDRATARKTLGLPPDRDLVLFVGNPTQSRKGFEIFEAAMRTISRSAMPPVRLVAGGSASMVSDTFADQILPGPVERNLALPVASPVGALDIDGDALVLSGLERRLMPALYGAADVLVHPSIIDNLPTVPIEAGLCGTRCLASDVGGTRETIADQNDLFDLGSSPVEIGARIASALEAAKAETVAQRRTRRETQLERFSLDTHRNKLTTLFKDTSSSGAAT